MTEKTQKQLIQETHETVVQLSTVLLGVQGTANGGLVKEVKDVKVSVNELAKSHSKLKRNFWVLIGILVGSGALGGGIYGLIN